MLKAIQILCCSSGFVIQYWKPRTRTIQGISSISIPLKPFSLYSPLRIVPTQDFSFVPKISTRRSRFRTFYASSTWSELNVDGPLASSSPSAHVRNIKFCQWCGGLTKHDVPEGEPRIRAICTICGKIANQNPKMDASCGLFGNWRVRETREEANADVEVLSPFVQLDIPLIGQVREKHPSFSFFP